MWRVNSGVGFDKYLDLWREGGSRIEVIGIAMNSVRFQIIFSDVGVDGVNWIWDEIMPEATDYWGGGRAMSGDRRED